MVKDWAEAIAGRRKRRTAARRARVRGERVFNGDILSC
jgi:hypothetical protein